MTKLCPATLFEMGGVVAGHFDSRDRHVLHFFFPGWRNLNFTVTNKPPLKRPRPDEGTTAKMPQNEYMERWRKLHGRRLDHEERARKRTAREGHKASKDAQELRGLRAKLHQEKRRKEKIQMKKQIKAHEERDVKTNDEKEPSTPMPSYLLDRSNPSTAKALSSAIKNKRAEKAAKFDVPL